MKKFYSIAIPKPCHEDWNQMSPKEKGKLCSSCSKTVIDFTKMNPDEIQSFIHQNKNNRICGHFKQTQLDSINLHIPSQILEQHNSFHKIFLLALLITMGTSLMNCTNKKGNQQKIDSVEVIDTLNNNKILNILEGIPVGKEIDPITKLTSSSNTKPEKIIREVEAIDGEIEIITVGDIDVNEPLINSDSLDINMPTWCPKPEDENDTEPLVFGFISVETPPEFKETPKKLSIQEKRDYFSKQISKIISENFNTSVCLELTGKQRIYIQFKIDKTGNVFDVKARAPHPKLEDEAKRVMKLLPQFIPAKQDGSPTTIVYTLPIIFQTEE